MTTLSYEVKDKNYLKIVDPDDGTHFHAWARGVTIEQKALEQAMDVAFLPFVEGVALMPDAHAGIGATVGSVIAMRGAVCPSIVGVDIGCGMLAARLPLNVNHTPFINDPLVRRNIRIAIQEAVPHGRTDPRKGADAGSWRYAPPQLVSDNWEANLAEDYNEFIEKAGDRFRHDYAPNQLGTLGTGNHFIEIDVDEVGDVWTVVHSGSRGPGNKIGSEFIKVAQKLNDRFFIKLPNKDLAYLPEGTPEFDGYMAGVRWAQNYAKVNRDIMTKLIWRAIEKVTGEEYGWYFDDEFVDCHHNYVTREWYNGKGNLLIARKGAIGARSGVRAFIPGARGAMSFIVEGLGNEEAFNSASHGAGRVMSRSQARKTITLDEDAAACEGIECNRSAELLDESKACYKPIEAVMEAQKDLVRPIHTLRQIINIKGEGE